MLYGGSTPALSEEIRCGFMRRKACPEKTLGIIRLFGDV